VNVWKEFCRHVESKISRRHFDGLADIIEQCAIFEFTDEQIHEAREHKPADLSAEEEHPIPPFPFPQMCMVGSGGVIVLQSPMMDEETGILEFEMMMCRMHDGAYFQKALCVVDSTKLDENGRFPMDVRETRGIWRDQYWDDDHPISPVHDSGMDPEEMERELAESRRKAERYLAEARRRGDPRRIEEAEKALSSIMETNAEYAPLIDKARELHADAALLAERTAEVEMKEMREAFYLGLQEVNWINHPDHFTVEIGAQEPPRKTKKSKGPRVRRLAERARHIILKKSDITTRWKKAHQGGTHAPPIPHLRRGHYKTLRAERFKEKRGKRIWVRASHVGGECVEWRDGDVRYKVI
jgi:hypothetical protein